METGRFSSTAIRIRDKVTRLVGGAVQPSRPVPGSGPAMAPAPPPPETSSALPDEAEFGRQYWADQAVDLRRFGPFLAHKFPPSGPAPWLDRDDAGEAIEARLAAGRITPQEAELCRQFVRDGYVVLERFFDAAEIDRCWGRYEAAVRDGRLTPSPEVKSADDPHPGHVMNAHLAVPELYELFADRRLLGLAHLLLGHEPIPFQTLVFPKGREQLAHSDTIHMTTYPLGYMCAAWIALEDIHPGSGPLTYYPGSHRIDPVFSRDVGITPEEFEQELYGAVAGKYEPRIQRLIRERDLKVETFLPAKGDVLVWHANLLHGGSPRTDVRPSRRSLVCHYFARGAFCYHDLSGKAAERV